MKRITKYIRITVHINSTNKLHQSYKCNDIKQITILQFSILFLSSKIKFYLNRI